jgi:uncharacterized iron-regulated membrane protein
LTSKAHQIQWFVNERRFQSATRTSAQPHEKIEALEAEIEALAEAAERCRKIMVAANAGTFAGAFFLVLSLLGSIGPIPFVLSIAAVLNKRTRDDILAQIRALEAQRSMMIDGLELQDAT